MKKYTAVVVLAVSLLVTSCSHELPENPPKKVTDPAMIAIYHKARQGDAASLEKLSDCYKDGLHGFPEDLAKVADCHEKLAALGKPMSQAFMALIYASPDYSCDTNRWPSKATSQKYLRMAYMSAQTEKEKEYVENIDQQIRVIRANLRIKSSSDRDFERGLMNPGNVSEPLNAAKNALLFF